MESNEKGEKGDFYKELEKLMGFYKNSYLSSYNILFKEEPKEDDDDVLRKKKLINKIKLFKKIFKNYLDFYPESMDFLNNNIKEISKFYERDIDLTKLEESEIKDLWIDLYIIYYCVIKIYHDCKKKEISEEDKLVLNIITESIRISNEKKLYDKTYGYLNKPTPIDGKEFINILSNITDNKNKTEIDLISKLFTEDGEGINYDYLSEELKKLKNDDCKDAINDISSMLCTNKDEKEKVTSMINNVFTTFLDNLKTSDNKISDENFMVDIIDKIKDSPDLENMIKTGEKINTLFDNNPLMSKIRENINNVTKKKNN